MISKERMIELAQGQLDAYNNRDVEKFLTFYETNVKVYRLNTNEVICDDFEKFRNMYVDLFARFPNQFCELKSRVVLTESVLDEEWVTGRGGDPTHIVAIYGFSENLIDRVWFTR
jgi:hypothetical protein